ncbi:MAG: type VI secretion system-associated FHA domain protein TagH [Pseudomonadota bacterium]|nr:type VI secretion system-associated FHA domain protein TagH [Pseudomonadales bacterium]MDY6920099.1 type VI secretion system-associated FHA domain protein TagH [Pseudomonadota bacterium]
MQLIIEVTSTERHLMGENARHVFYPAGGVIGRSPQCDWVIPDQTRHLSGRHAIVSYESGQFFLTDISTNGVFLNGTEQLERNRATPIGEGDRLLMGEIHFQVQVRAVAGKQPPASAPRPTPPLQPEAGDPMARVDQWLAQREQQAVAGQAEGWHQQGISMPDHAPAEQTPFSPPQPQSEAAPAAREPAPALPENWWQEPPPEAATSAQTVTEKGVGSPVADAARGSVDGEATALQAFAAGLGITEGELREAGGTEFLQRAGGLLQQCLRGLVAAAQARASLKNELRLDMTLVSGQGNNPIKLSANGEQAVRHLLAPETGSFMTMEQAVDECFTDFQSHQLAMIAGMQGALVELLETLAPAALEARFEQTRGGGLSLGSRPARYWEAYRALHRDLLAEEDLFHSFFAEPFARAYDERSARLKQSASKKEK